MATNGLFRALTQNAAQTHQGSEDRRLRGRTYVVPFATVWDEIIGMIESDPRWTLIKADEGSGTIRAEAKTRVLGLIDDVRFRVKLDQNALTRVDMRSSSRIGRGDFGVNARRIARFYKNLDRRLEARA